MSVTALNSPETRICIVIGDNIGDPVAVANSKLIAAAPTMAEALREAYQISHYGRGSMQDIDDVLERAIRSTSAKEVSK
jgi:hypothetical protein